MVSFTGDVPSFGLCMPVPPDTSILMTLMVRLLQFYFCGLAMFAFMGFRFMQEILRGHKARKPSAKRSICLA